NRRNDVFFCPDLEDYNIRNFLNLIQLDGYNPLEIRPATFTVREESLEEAVKYMTDACSGSSLNCRGSENTVADGFAKLLSGKFKPGQLFRFINSRGLKLTAEPGELIEKIMPLCNGNYEAGSSEGYWTDHWDYIMDLVEDYLSIYPDRLHELMHSEGYMFYDSALQVRDRSETYTEDGTAVRQYDSAIYNEDKIKEPGFTAGETNWKKNADGSIVKTSFAVKMLTLMLTKTASLDSYGMGIEMEGGKPGWNDAMNGLPAMFGSSMPETFELVRIVDFLIDSLGEEKLEIPVEVMDFYENIRDLITKYPLPVPIENEPDGNEGNDDFVYWDHAAGAREKYRKTIYRALSGKTLQVDENDIREFCVKVKQRLNAGIEKAKTLSGGEIPTYFTYEPTNRDRNEGPDGKISIRVKGFRVNTLPVFLEGPARYLAKGASDAAQIHEKVLQSDLYDRKLKMFKTSGFLEDLSLQYGRIRAFTPGWLERESIFLHMEYKYLYALLKNRLYTEFYEAIKTAFVPFMDPAVYGRSILENSSFIASSANPDPKVHGRGFVARLSGSTTEVISMWIAMFIGNRTFYVEDGILKIGFAPALATDFFNDNGEASWTFMGRCRIVYHNPSHRATFGENASAVRSIKLLNTDGEETEIEGSILEGETALALREGRIIRIDAYME
ncbi:MAG: cellobiose phosphorylase, partial [Lachnospiraceae bacterium]|nr:cellobiose phosphorylase [Lachnospiraceae bacterium]